MARAPYPGLRAFDSDEADIFFGRERQVDAMIDRLARQRFLAVTGTSGCGKSSLVRAGLLEALQMGLLAEAGPVWRFVLMRPREHPMARLASRLIEALGGNASMEATALRRAALDRGPLSLVEELREWPLPEHADMLILIDQFEELFRYRDLASQEEAEAFVALLLATAGQRELPVYIVLTMRSDFFGECARFEGLAEAVCESIYLCPGLSRDQIIAAIEGPARVFGGRVEPVLVARIANDMGTEPDQLPLMQHALMRLWEEALRRDPGAPQPRLDDYLAAGGLKASLSRHADEILAEVTRASLARSEIARHLFCLVTEGEGERATRRLAPVAEVAAVSEQPTGEVANVADAFRAPGCSLLMPPPDRALTEASVLDITHESLIRQWDTLKEWERREAESVRQYREAERNVHRWMSGRAALWQPEELRSLLAWCTQERPNPAWAARYGGAFALVAKLLERSRLQWKMARYALAVAFLPLVFLIVFDTLREGIQASASTWAVLGFIIIGLVVSYKPRQFSVARNWIGGLLLTIIILIVGGFYSMLSGDLKWENYIPLVWAALMIEVACLGFAFLQLRRLARIRRHRHLAPAQWLSEWLLRRRGAPVPPVGPLWIAAQAAADARDFELRRLEQEAEHWPAAVRRDAAVTAAMVAVPVIPALVWAVMVWSGVRQVEAEMNFVTIPAGCFEMGSPDSEADRSPDEGPVRNVCIKSFALGQNEVTQGEWHLVMVFPNDPNPSSFHDNDRRPVENVSWNDVQRFLWAMSLFGKLRYRLPSEAEWEYAARAGTTTPWYWGDAGDEACLHENIADQSRKKKNSNVVVANCDDGYAETAPVGSFQPNRWGLHDMLGNVLQWVEDCYVDNYSDRPADGSPNTKGLCAEHVARGGSWLTSPKYDRSAARFQLSPGFRGNGTGFRVARTLTGKTAEDAPASSAH